jgi:OOP family OmpA-OmpF porin
MNEKGISMRKLAILAALATSALTTPALARDGAWYVGVEGGAMIVEDTNFDIGASNNAVTLDSKYGFDVDGIIGYDFGALRVEGEVGYKQADTDEFQTTVALPGGASAASPAGLYRITGGKTTALSFMLNGLLDFGADTGISGFVGGGAGIARVKADDYRLINSGRGFLSDSDTRFAWQVLAGVRAPLSSNVDVGLKYRFFNVNDIRMTTASGQTAESRFRSHAVLASLIFNFGEPAAPPPPVTPGPFIVFFDWDKSVITPEAASILDNAAQAYATTGQASVMLAGHADKSGSDSYNVGLSQRRADAVKTYLTGRGVPGGSVSTEAFGESRPLVETADGVREPQNRRVEITFGPGSGQ